MGPKPRKKFIMPPRSFIKMRHCPRMVLDSPGLAFITRVLMLSIGAVLNDTQNPAITLDTNRSECPSFIQPRSLIAFLLESYEPRYAAFSCVARTTVGTVPL